MPSILHQLALANESEGGGCVVILADRDKPDMDDDVAEMDFDFRGTYVVTRTGTPIDAHDLARCSPATARSIIILSGALACVWARGLRVRA